RKDWTEERIRMTINRLILPNYNLEDFICEYDHEYLENRLNILQKQFSLFIQILKPLGFKDWKKAFNSWEELFEIMSQPDAFEIPLLSPSGLLILSQQIQSDLIEDLLLESINRPIKLFGQKYQI